MGKSYRLPEKAVPLTLELGCVITSDEADRARREVLELEQKCLAAVAKRKELDGTIAGLKSAIARKVRVTLELFEYRPVLCEERHIWARGVVEVVRLDTRTLVSRRAMTPEERAKLEKESEES